MGITVTEAAAAHVSKNLQKRGAGLGIRVGVRTSGCSGMAYVLEYVDEEVPQDNVYEGFGVKVYVDPKSLVYLEGKELDFIKEGLNEGFEFKNPNASAECGCGESFTV